MYRIGPGEDDVLWAGLGLSETRLNRFLFGKKRKDYVLSTKVGRLLEVCPPQERTGIGKFFDTPSRKERFDYTYDGFMRSIEFSLERLGVDSIDIIFVHDVDVFTHKSEAARDAHVKTLMSSGYKALVKLREQKVIKAFGAGINEWQVAETLTRAGDFDIFLLAGRYLRARRQEGWISVVTIFSVLGITLGVATLIIVMSVMNGFRAEIMAKILGFRGHYMIQSSGGTLDNWDSMAARISKVPGVSRATPFVEGQALATAQGMSPGVVVRGLRPQDIANIKLVSDSLKPGVLQRFQRDGSSILMGETLANNMGLQQGMKRGSREPTWASCAGCWRMSYSLAGKSASSIAWIARRVG
jgi:hypothetical protein